MNKRCDENPDCHDGSDEKNCQQILIDKNIYRKTNIPKNPIEKGPLKIGVGFDVINIVQINEAEVRMIQRLLKPGHCIFV